MVKRRTDGTLRITARLGSNNWMKPQTPLRKKITSFFVEHNRPPNEEELDEIERSLVDKR